MRKYYQVDLPLSFRFKTHEALISVWWTSDMLSKESRKLFKSFRMSESQFNLLMILKYVPPPLTQNDISKRMLVDKPNVTCLIDKLEKLKLIRRNKVERDRRRYHISLTNIGMKFIDKIDKVYEKKVNHIMHLFTKKEADELIRLTKLIREALAEIK